MYPNVPSTDISWPITQHAGIIDKTVIINLLNACAQFNGQRANSSIINQHIIKSGILTHNFRRDSGQVDAWRDYQQILSELGLIYSTRITQEIILTPIATAFLDGDVSYDELITLQLLKYQYPNGHKTQLSPVFKHGYAKSIGATTFTEIQTSFGILLRPAVLVFSVMEKLLTNGENPTLTIDELQTYLARCLTNNDCDMCAHYIINSRHDNLFELAPLPRARRNMQDWIKLLAQTQIFNSSDYKEISFSDFALSHIEELKQICDNLSAPESFWIYNGEPDYKFNWYSFYGNINLNYNFIPSDNNLAIGHTAVNSASGTAADNHQSNLTDKSEINLRPYSSTVHGFTNSNQRQIISKYDYNKSQKGYYLHDSMVSFIAQRCISKGAEVYEDRSSIDLLIKHDNREYLVEVKSVTPNNFIARLRSAIGQVYQYDYLFPQNNERRLGLAFTASVPHNSWVVPFITSHLNMDLITMDNDDLLISTNDQYSRNLFGK